MNTIENITENAAFAPKENNNMIMLYHTLGPWQYQRYL